MNQYEAEADGQTSEVVGGTIGLCGSTEYDEHVITVANIVTVILVILKNLFKQIF